MVLYFNITHIMNYIEHNDKQLTIIIALISAIATVIATSAALSSAKYASESFRASAESEKRMNIRNLLLDAHSVEVELDRIEQLGNNLKLSYQSLAALSNAIGNTRVGVYQDDLKKKIECAKSISEASKVLTSNPDALQEWDCKTIAEKHIEISAALLRLNALKDIISMQYSKVITQLNDVRNDKSI